MLDLQKPKALQKKVPQSILANKTRKYQQKNINYNTYSRTTIAQTRKPYISIVYIVQISI